MHGQYIFIILLDLSLIRFFEHISGIMLSLVSLEDSRTDFTNLVFVDY